MGKGKDGGDEVRSFLNSMLVGRVGGSKRKRRKGHKGIDCPLAAFASFASMALVFADKGTEFFGQCGGIEG